MANGEFTDRVVLVTGAGSGIGRAVARRFGDTGATVVVTDVDRDRAEETAAQLVADGGQARVEGLDVTSSADVNRVVGVAGDDLGRLDVVVNNAGIVDNLGYVTEVSDEEWQRVIGVNLTGVFNVARAAIPPLLATGGAMVNIASVAGLGGGKAGAAYTASKHGVVGLTRNLAWMYADQGIRVNAVCPGGVATNIVDSSPGFDRQGMQRLKPIMAAQLRTAAPEEIAAVVAFLASPAASFVNGAILTADGGWVAG